MSVISTGKRYSARLYRTVQSGIKVTAVFCMTLEHPQYTKVTQPSPRRLTFLTLLNAQYCDEVIARSYPELGKQVKHRTVHNALVITAGRVQLATAEATSWKVAMDKSGVS